MDEVNSDLTHKQVLNLARRAPGQCPPGCEAGFGAEEDIRERSSGKSILQTVSRKRTEPGEMVIQERR